MRWSCEIDASFCRFVHKHQDNVVLVVDASGSMQALPSSKQGALDVRSFGRHT